MPRISPVAFALLLPLLAAAWTSSSLAASVVVRSFNSMAEFQASSLYAFVTGTGGGLATRRPRGVRGLRQGTSDVPTTSAGTLGNVEVTNEVLAAALDVPDVFSLDPTPARYQKRFVSLGTATAGNAPFITLSIAPASSLPAGGFEGYDIVVFDLGKHLAEGTGNHNGEATIFEVELIGQGTVYPVGTISATGANFINAILLDITGIPGIPPAIDAVRISDVTGAAVPERGGIDLDGALTLNSDGVTEARSSSWGAIKTLYRD